MATPADLDTIARALPGVSVGKYWDDPAAYLMEGKGVRGGRGLAHLDSISRDDLAALLELAWESKQR